MSRVPLVELERVARVTPVGVRPWDAATGRAAEPGLTVVCRLPGGRAVPAFPGPSGCYSAHGIPGLRAAEYPADTDAAGDTAYWYHPQASARVRIEIVDPLGRYVPTSFEAVVPHRGPVVPACRTPGPAAPVVPLFPAASRPVPAGFAAVRAQLAQTSGAAAGWALLDVALPDGSTATGMADGAGRATVIMAYPEPEPPVPGGGPIPLRAREWPVTVSARFGAAGRPDAEPLAGPDDVPDLCAVLAQRPARLHVGPARLRYGRELVLRTAGRSTLLLSAE